jgi:kumamolisin
VTDLASSGSTGTGVTIGIISGGAYGAVDVQSFWQSFGISRADPVAEVTMEPPLERLSETTVDVEWSAAMAPGATVIVYEAPDARDTSLLFTIHEAVARAEAQILSDSFSAREDSEAAAVREVYDHAGIEAAALGITLVASSGDEAMTDVPSASPFVTAVGGTALSFDDAGADYAEVAWSLSGSGPTTFDVPVWQSTVVSGAHRMTADLAINAGPAYWWYFLGSWGQAYGTSFSSPLFAGIMADVQSARNVAGKPAVGYLNPILYTVPAVQAAFRDITVGSTAHFEAGAGWDPPTGWGAVRAEALAAALP